jgi:hypothetical protein
MFAAEDCTSPHLTPKPCRCADLDLEDFRSLTIGRAYCGSDDESEGIRFIRSPMCNDNLHGRPTTIMMAGMGSAFEAKPIPAP